MAPGRWPSSPGGSCASRPDTAAGRGDVTLSLAPVICLVASTLVVVRLVPVLLHAAARLALRSPGLVLPLSFHQSARRPTRHGLGADRSGGRGGDVRARAALDLGALAGDQADLGSAPT